MKVAIFFIEPAKYSLNLIEEVYKHKDEEFSFYFLHSSTYHNDKDFTYGDMTFLETMSFTKKLAVLRSAYKKHNILILNGYSHYVFFYFAIRNVLSPRTSKPICIESDTFFRKSERLKNFIRGCILKPFFVQNWLYGFAGGTGLHVKMFTAHGVQRKRVFTMPMISKVIDLNSIPPRSVNNSHTQNLRFLFVGRIIERKGIVNLVSSFTKLLSIHPSSELHLIGEGSLSAMVEGHNCPQIYLHGSKYGTNLSETMLKCDVNILPSNSEPWGLVVNEALSLGIPCIVSSDVGCKEDLIIGKGTGLVFENNDKDGLYNRMLEMAELYYQTEPFEKMRQNAFDLMKNTWNYDLYKRNFSFALNYIVQSHA